MSAPKSKPSFAPFVWVLGIFSLSFVCLALAIWLMPSWQKQVALAKEPSYKFTPTAVFLRGERYTNEAENQGLVVIPAPAQRAVSHTIPFPKAEISTTLVPAIASPTVAITSKKPRWITNARPVTLSKNTVKIAIIIDDMGVAEDLSWRVINELPKAVTLSFLPYGEATDTQAKKAFSQGHEIMVHLPMQPHRKTANPGPNALYVSDDEAQIQRNIAVNLNSLKSLSVGVNNHMGSRFTESLTGMRTVLNALEAERLFFLDSVTTPKSAVATARTGLALPILARDTFIDHEATEEFTLNALQKTERIAQQKGYAVAIGHPYATTINAIKLWTETLKDKGVVLVPISYLLEKEE